METKGQDREGGEKRMKRSGLNSLRPNLGKDTVTMANETTPENTTVNTTASRKSPDRAHPWNNYRPAEWKIFTQTDLFTEMYILPLPGEKTPADVMAEKYTEEQIKQLQDIGVYDDMIKLVEAKLAAEKTAGKFPDVVTSAQYFGQPAIRFLNKIPRSWRINGNSIGQNAAEMLVTFGDLVNKRADNVTPDLDKKTAVTWSKESLRLILRTHGAMEMTPKALSAEDIAANDAKLAAATEAVDKALALTDEQIKVHELKVLRDRMIEKNADIVISFDLTSEAEGDYDALKEMTRPAGE